MLAQQLFNGIVLGSVYALFGLGFNLVLGALNILNIAHAAIFTWGAFIGLYLIVALHWPFVPALLVAVGGGGLLAVVVEHVAVRPLRRRGGDEMSAVVATLGASIVLVSLAQMASDSQIVRFPLEVFPETAARVGPIRVTLIQVVILVTTLSMMVATQLFLRRTRVGKAVRCIAFDERTAEVLGIPTRRVIRGTFFLAGALAGTAGILIGLAFSTVHFLMGEPYLLKGFVVVVVGGFGSVPGTIIASLVLGLIEVLSVVVGSGAFRDAISFALLILILILRPNGLFGTTEEVRP